MSIQSAKDFLDSAQNNEEIQQEISKAMQSDDDRQAVTDLAKSKGYEFSSDELWAEVKKRQEELKAQPSELNDEALEAIAGGEFVVLGLTIASAGLSVAISAEAPPAKW